MKKKIAIFLIIACAFTAFGIDAPIEVSAKTKVGKVKNFIIDYSSTDGVRLDWSKYKKADGYQIYRDNSRIKTIKARKLKKTYTYTDKKFDMQNNDRYLVKAYKVVKVKGKKVKKVIAKSQTIYFHKEYFGAGEQNGNNVEFTHDGDSFIISGYYNGIPVFDKRDDIRVKLNTSDYYESKIVAFYGRKIVGVDDSGYVLGPWEKLFESGRTTENFNFIVPGNYIALGFEFDILRGTDYPYSDVFMNYEGHDFLTNPHPNQTKNVEIEMGGGAKTAWIKINVNGKNIFYDANCDSHDRNPLFKFI